MSMKDDSYLEETISTYNRISSSYAARWDRLTKTEMYHLNLFLSFLQGNLIIDAGCGTGKDGLYFKKKGYRVIGLDLSEKMLNYACKRIEVIKSDFRLTSFGDKSIDGVWCNSALVHIKDKFTFIDETYRILKNRGIIGITLQNKFYPKYLLRQLQTFLKKRKFEFGYANYDGRHWYYLDIKQLFNLFDERFEIIFYTKNPFERWLRIYARKR